MNAGPRIGIEDLKNACHLLITALLTTQPAIHIPYNKSSVEHLLFCKQVVHVLLGTSAAQRHFVIGMRQFFADLARVKRDT